MRRSSFKRPKMVLIFNGAQILVAITRSLHSAAELTKGNLQAISFCCTGKYICSGGFYFRHLHPNVEIELQDLGTLQLQDYDSLCGEKRTITRSGKWHISGHYAKRKVNRKTEIPTKTKIHERI